jgi:hypothetical protein
MSEEIAVHKSSGNVFADLGFDNPEEEQLKAQLVREIRDILKGAPPDTSQGRGYSGSSAA